MRRARTTLSWHPEWPLAAVGLACWLLLVVVALSPEPADHPASHHLSSHADQMNLLGAGDITLMFVGTAAMMIPVGLRSAHHVALSTFRSQRVIALTSFQLGYLLVPIALTAGSSALFVLSGVQDERWLVPVLLVLAAAWQLTPWKTTALGRCARTIPLRPFGWAATWSCTEFGIRRGTRCLEAAWPVMVLASALGHENLVAMLALTAVMVVEAGPIQLALRSRRPVLGLLAGGLVLTILGWVLAPDDHDMQAHVAPSEPCRSAPTGGQQRA